MREFESSSQDEKINVTKDINSQSTSHHNSKNNTSLIIEAQKLLYENNIAQAISAVKEARINDIENKSLRAFDTALQQWNSYTSEIRVLNDFEKKGDFLFDKWQGFCNLHKKSLTQKTHKTLVATLDSQSFDAIQHFVIKLIQICYKNAIRNNPEKKQNLQFKLKVFKCMKLLGEHEKAWHFIKSLCSKLPYDAYLKSQLADCYNLIGKESVSKLLFKEAFYINPIGIKLEDIESVFIHDIAHKIKNQAKYNEKYLLEWIPVYGYLDKSFFISRQLKPIEIDTLLQEIVEMEAKLDDHKALGRDDPFIIMPRLINRYFWIMDYYKHTKNTNELNNILAKIQNLDEEIYKTLEI